MVVKRRSFAQARKAAGYTQEGLAERLGVDRTTVARWEAGSTSRSPGSALGSPKRSGSRWLRAMSCWMGVKRRGDAVEVSVSVVKADGVPLAGYDQMPAAEHDHGTRSLVSAGDAPPESPAYYYHEGLLASHQSECLLLLKKSNEAAVSARTGLTVFNTSYVDGYALCTLHLGSSYLQAGEVEEATQVIGSAASLAAQNRQARLVKELHTVRARLEP